MISVSESTKKTQVSVILLNYNEKAFLNKCLSSLQQQTYRSFNVILVDNASTDGSVSYVKKEFPWVTLVENRENVGFSAGCNSGVKFSDADYIVFLNCDTMVDKKWLEMLIAGVETNRAGICGAKILDMTNPALIQEVGGLSDQFGFSLSQGWGELDKAKYNMSRETFYVSGASLLIKKEVINKIGLFDSAYFFNQEDVDICWRAHLAGYKVVVNPLAVVYHKGGGSAQGAPGSNVNNVKGSYVTSAWRRYYAERNILRTLLKNYQLISLVKLLLPFFVIFFSEIVYYIFSGRLNVAEAYLKALLWNFQHLKDTLYNRQIVQSIRSVSDREIRKLMIPGIGKILRFKQIGRPNYA
ncbi:MAG: glycosyltransferase family 2 protein [Nitrososphaerota archaeon]|nr:glycosyltransferase family 2 protein [Nitrososphaerota archaeon]